MDLILALQYLLSLLSLSVIIFALGLMKRWLLQLSASLSARAERKYHLR